MARIKQTTIVALITALTTLVGALGAFNLHLSYVKEGYRQEEQQKLGKLAQKMGAFSLTISKGCKDV